MYRKEIFRQLATVLRSHATECLVTPHLGSKFAFQNSLSVKFYPIAIIFISINIEQNAKINSVWNPVLV